MTFIISSSCVQWTSLQRSDPESAGASRNGTRGLPQTSLLEEGNQRSREHAENVPCPAASSIDRVQCSSVIGLEPAYSA
ncbi:hypothetical protein V5799_002190 [Amblyomma americanum]|uniref:Uncharacterized protein n=1 Tax=Amblyomma americanum TaxID=6943 RepID=A0AAQ4CY18_AMBAM